MRHINDRCGANEHKGQLNKRNHWLISFLSLATIIHTSYLTMAAICEDNTILSVPLASTILLFSVGLWFGRKQKNLYYLATIPFATLMILLTTFISHSNLKNVNLFLFAGIIVITGTTLIIYFILHLKGNGMAQKNNLTIQVVSIIGGILTAIFFLGFLVVASIIRTETSSLIIGCLFIITTLTISRRLTVPFLDAMNITLYIAGCALIAYGLNKSTNALFIALAITGIFTFFLSKGFILPFLSVILFIISFLGELAYLSSSIQLLQIAVVPVLAVFLFTNLYERDILTGLKENLVSKYTPFHSGLFVSCICLLAGLSVNYGIPAPYWLLSIFIWIGILLIIQRIMPVMEVTNPVSQIGICILCILICLPTMFAPYLSGSLLLILICFHYGYKAECAAALLLFIYAVSKYYYDLNLSLLVKSITLFFTGIIFMIAWYYFTQKRTKHEKTESDTDYH